ncbi:MAG: hypothetical protein R2798_11910 [Chitinophagales bacterium]|nr:hypothetical protein [Bacteroidota bacterium]MCB9043606.1 hypothetical protein [Chitinophagales bacterium]
MMKIKICALYFWGILFVFYTNTQAQQLSATLQIDTNAILVGAPLTISVKTIFPKEGKILQPQWNSNQLDTFEILQKQQPEQQMRGDWITLTQKLQLTAWDTGFLVISPIPLEVLMPNNDTLRTQSKPALIQVRTFAIDTTKGIQPITDPYKLPLTWRDYQYYLYYFLGVLAVVAMLFLAWWIWRKYYQKQQAIKQDAPPVPPNEEALTALQKLRSDQLWQQGLLKEYYSRLSEITRRYIERRYNTNALESTTSEIMSDLEKTDFPQEYITPLRNNLYQSDMVKFAKASPPTENHAQAFDFVQDLVEKTTPLTEKEENDEEIK